MCRFHGHSAFLSYYKGNLPRDVKTARLLRWVGQLDDVLLHSGPDDKGKNNALACLQASSSSNENNNEETPIDSASATSPQQSSASAAAAGEMSDLRNACAALASELRAELDAPAVAAAAAKEKAANEEELQEVAATSTSASRSEQLVGGPVDGSSTPASSQATNKQASKVAKKKAMLRPPLRGKELAKRLATGWGLGAACTAWIFSGNAGHAAGLYLLAIVAQVRSRGEVGGGWGFGIHEVGR